MLGLEILAQLASLERLRRAYQTQLHCSFELSIRLLELMCARHAVAGAADALRLH